MQGFSGMLQLIHWHACHAQYKNVNEPSHICIEVVDPV